MHFSRVPTAFSGSLVSVEDEEGDPSRNTKQKIDIRVKAKHGTGFRTEGGIHYGLQGGGNSGFQACNFAYLKGAKTILLVGFDMFGKHFFGDHPAPLVNGSPYDQFIRCFERVECEKLGIEIINCSRQTALKCFPRIPLESLT